MSLPPVKPRAALPASEWDFSRVDPDERWLCTGYELSREAALQERRQTGAGPAEAAAAPVRLEDVVERLRRALDVKTFDEGLAAGLHVFLARPFYLPVLYPEWPGRGYLTLPASERQRVQPTLGRRRDDEASARLLTTPRPGDTRITLSIPPWLSHRGVMELMPGLLRALVPKQGGAAKGGGGRRRQRDDAADDLRAITVLRLTQAGLSRAQAVTQMEAAANLAGVKPPYAAEKALDKPLRRARSKVARCRRPFFWRCCNAPRTTRYPCCGCGSSCRKTAGCGPAKSCGF